MPEWLVEEGIAEHRAVRLQSDRITAARVHWPGRVAAGWVVEAKLLSRAGGSSRATARADTGEEILVDRLPRDASEGAALRVVVTRAALEGPGRLKRAQGRPSEGPLAQPTLAEQLRAEGNGVQTVRDFTTSGWDDLIDDALGGAIPFAGGSLLFAPTAAMTTIDVDGDLPPPALALAAVRPVAEALPRLDIGGSMAIDFPSLAHKTDRRAIDTALGEALANWPHERTAMNGFGLIQVVARLERASLLQLASWRRAELTWRRLLRCAERLTGPGTTELAIHPSLERVMESAHIAELERRTGTAVKIRKVATLVPDAPHTQRVAND